jgi:hypothetical protein
LNPRGASCFAGNQAESVNGTVTDANEFSRTCTRESSTPGRFPSPREALVRALGEAVAAATAAGDLEVARIAVEALGKLLAAPSSVPATVVDLASERGRREG